MSLPPSLYCYSSLPEGSIRLLRLLPHQDEHALIQCQLFEFALVDSRSTRPYEALSYVWGSETKPRSLSIDSCDLPVGENLYAALSHLRDCSLERIIWVDAICINQRDIKEKGTQVQSMAEIYAKASDVIVWLGEATPDSCQALEEIRVAAEQRTTLSIDESAILRLLERPWFQRIWVLQEVAAARHVLIKCGPTEIDGYAFCSGLSALDLSYETSPDLEPLIRSVAYLIRGAVFRSRGATSRSGRFSLDICSLGELVDMYHTRKATMRHDKVFALFGMSSDDPSIAGLSVNYEISWKQLFQQLVNFVFSERASVDTWDDKEMAVIRGKGCVLGRVSSVERDVDREDRQHMWITWTNEFDYGEPNSPWTFQAPAKSVQVGDAICLLQGASMPTIIRPRNDYWVVVMIAIPPPDDLQAASRDTESELLRLITTFPHDFLLVWDWDMYPDESQDIEDYKHFIGAHMSQYPKVELEDHLDKVLRLRDTGVALQDMGRYEEATENFGKAMDIFEGVVRNMDCLKLACPGHGSWRKGDVEKLEGMVGLLIKDKGGWMPLCFAAESGLETMVKLSLSTSEVDLNAEAGRNRTPLLLAVKNGHEAIVKILLDTDKVDVNATDIYGETPLSVAAENGHEAIVKLLLGTDKVDLETPDEFRRTVLSQAARKGQEAIVKLLLDTDKVDLNATDIYERMPLSVAAEKGHEGIIKLLLSTGKVNPNATDWSGQTALSLAAANGQEAIVKMLLGSDKVDPDAQDRHRRTPFWWAAENGHEAIVKMLIGHGKVDLDIKAGPFSRTPLLVAAKEGHEGIAKLLLSTGKVDPDAQGTDGRTPFWFAADNGHEGIVKLLRSA
ncbi:hypothetical protein CDV31_005260 [Fusarium ambrosium]|uniref:Heterokaryon incompatibility domain-containing protein n=1 Tax=Fusarium ambrosium TaxID=131363 RepID=A0A428UKL5_9HYPO|nr:hypothetical protein CDV31_005260 [Fusarium ambrosium]